MQVKITTDDVTNSCPGMGQAQSGALVKPVNVIQALLSW